jgi:hypothetical protein
VIEFPTGIGRVRLLTNANIAAAIREAQAAGSECTKITADMVVN